MTVPLRSTALTVLTVAGLLSGSGVSGQAPQGCDDRPTGGLPRDCTLEVPPLFLGFDYTPAATDGRRGTLTVTQSTAEGGLRDITGPFEMVGQLSGPVLRDVDGDDSPDIVIQSRPTAFDIWLVGEEGFYRMIGRINARRAEDIEARGALTVSRVDEAGGSTLETAYLLDGGQVVTVFQMRIDPASRTCRMIGAAEAGRDWLNTDVLIADCEARDWN